MIKYLTLHFVFLLFIVPGNAQVISTFASGTLIYDPNQIAFDRNGSLFCATNIGNRVIKIDTNGVTSPFAGTGSNGFSGDGGPATLAELAQPSAVTTDSIGNVYIADVQNNRIRKVDATTGIITTIAGTGFGSPTSGGFSGDSGQATAANFFYPSGLQFDKYGNLYVADFMNGRIRKIDTSGIITTVAGNGLAGSSGDGSSATMASCRPTANICIDAIGNLFFSDWGNYTVRKVDPFGIISTVAGDTTGMWAYSGDGVPALGAGVGPLAIALDESGQLIIADGNNRIRRVVNYGIIHTIAGNGVGGSSGDGGPADSAEIYTPSGLAFDHCHNLYISQVDAGPRIRKVTFNPYCWPSQVPEIPSTELTIYPNPCTETLYIDNVRTNTRYSLFNITGIMITKGTLAGGSNTISLAGLVAGVYLIKIIDNNGQETVRRVVKW